MRDKLIAIVDKVTEDYLWAIVKTSSLVSIDKFNSALVSGLVFDFILMRKDSITAVRNCRVDYMKMDGSRIVLKRVF